MAAWGWSMGGYGSLRLAEVKPHWLKAVAAFSPAVEPDDRAFGGVARWPASRGRVVRDVGPAVRERAQFVAAMPQRPDPLFYGAGAHTRAYWDSVTLPAFASSVSSSRLLDRVPAWT